MSQPERLPRFCTETRSQLASLAADELSGWPLHVVRAHLRRCAGCTAQYERQQQLAAALSSLKKAPATPPPGLLDNLLARADSPGVRE